MKVNTVDGAGNEYPYIVVRYGARNTSREAVTIEVGPYEYRSEPDYVINAPEPLDEEGKLHCGVRNALLDMVRIKATRDHLQTCIVWGENDCTFVSPGGHTHDSDMPPPSDRTDVEVNLTPAHVEPCFSVAFATPERPDRYFICAKRAGDLVEIALGEHMVLGDMPAPETPIPPELDPEGKLAGLDDPWPVIAHYRGQPVTKIESDAYLGPVQPVQDAESIMLHDPWPHEIAAACLNVAQLRGSEEIPSRIIDAVWDAVRPRRLPLAA